ncbi:MAG: MarR family transcriptional regulator [Actinobacteria bacterium]|nr:MarR family transcriptional regulator [Actinomycetota bacterium]
MSAPITPVLADDLLLLVTRLARRLRRVAAADAVTPTQRSILTTLERHGPCTHGELADAERVRPPTITAAVDRLEAQGLVARARDATDRRVARVALTAEGRTLLTEARRQRTAYLEQRLRALTPADRASIAAAAPALLRLLEEGPR